MTETNVQDATRTHYCKFGNCTNEVKGAVGRWAYCDEHQGRASENPNHPQAPTTDERKRGPRPDTDTSMVKRLAGLQKLAREADAWRKRAEKLTREAVAARKAADEADRTFAQAVKDLQP